MQRLQERHAAFQPSAGLQHTRDLSCAEKGISDVFEHRDRDHAFERSVFEGKRIGDADDIGCRIVHDLDIDDVAVIDRPVAGADVKYQPVLAIFDQRDGFLVIAVFADGDVVVQIFARARRVIEKSELPARIERRVRLQQQRAQRRELSFADRGQRALALLAPVLKPADARVMRVAGRIFSALQRAANIGVGGHITIFVEILGCDALFVGDFLAAPLDTPESLEMRPSRSEFSQPHRLRHVRIGGEVAGFVEGFVRRLLLQGSRLEGIVHGPRHGLVQRGTVSTCSPRREACKIRKIKRAWPFAAARIFSPRPKRPGKG